MGERRKIFIALTVTSLLATYCDSVILRRSQLSLEETMSETGNITGKVQHIIDNIMTFDMFKETFKKTYKNVGAEQKALQNFVLNQKEISRHNIEYTAGKVSYTRALWEYSDLSTEEVNKHMNGFVRPITTRASQDTENVVKPPKSLNWVKKGFVTKGDINREKHQMSEILLNSIFSTKTRTLWLLLEFLSNWCN